MSTPADTHNAPDGVVMGTKPDGTVVAPPPDAAALLSSTPDPRAPPLPPRRTELGTQPPPLPPRPAHADDAAFPMTLHGVPAPTTDAERAALPATLRDVPAPARDVKGAIDALADTAVAARDIRAPGAHALPLKGLVGIPFYEDRPMLQELPKEDVWNLLRRFDRVSRAPCARSRTC
jgi:hypothetical protein